ncbi:hypothetical protein GGS23DRAFT_22022 [Durotheca rogersii]|uniref:uncharacterized protein n=1 Tax=Durotheca rogersii TaxID=419775 RepID=UPI0022212592|nr:uncharacterized protein GGS23DRAFT_22022 [Durotheca rogersii]KAI5868324.1 hypothetical protein GGS23DRAFT_22022 [Durotheca rogersii]
MIGTMPYQYPSPQDGAVIDMPHSGYAGGYPVPTTSALEETHDIDHVPFGLSNEKKRNKLGYHRTPIACGHCRRRKIRCKQPEIPDVLGRCESCISLKKECVYHAVNQPPPPIPPTGQRQGTKTSNSSGLESSSTSPALSAGHSGEAQPNTPYHQMATMPNMGQQSIGPRGGESYSVEPKVPPNAPNGRTFDYAHGIGSWVTTEASAGVSRTSNDTNSQWTTNFANGMPEPSDFPQYSPHAPSPSMTWPAALGTPGRMDANGRLGDTWKPYSPAARSMSFSGDQSSQYPPSTRPYERAQPPMAPHVKIEGVPEMALNHQNGSLSAGAEPHPSYGTWQQPYPYAKAGEEYGGWYGGTGEHQPGAHVSSVAEDTSGMYYGGR